MQDLDKFKNEMNLSGKNVYVGHRYVPKIFGEWDNTQVYEPLSIVKHQGNSFTSRQFVPVGIDINNEEYWASTGNYNAQIEQYRQEVRTLDTRYASVNNEVIDARNGEETLNDRLVKDKQEIDDQLTLTNEQLALTNAEVLINVGDTLNPERFEGTDGEKIQQAIDESLASRGAKYIELKRTYDLTGATLHINKGTDLRYPLYFIGGGLKKDDAGFMFTSDIKNSSDIYFEHVRFESTEGIGTKIFDLDMIIRLHTTDCQFINVDTIWKSVTRWAQSIRSKGDTITGGVGAAFDAEARAIDCTFDDLTLEHRQDGIKIYKPESVRIVNSVLEGLSGTAIKIIHDTMGLFIEGNYFESNTQDIDLSTMVQGNTIRIYNNMHYAQAKEWQSSSMIVWGNIVSTVSSELNRWHEGRIHDGTRITGGKVQSYSDYSGVADIGIDNINYHDIIKYEEIDGTTKSWMGQFKRYSKVIKCRVPANGKESFTATFSEKVYSDDLVSIQVHDEFASLYNYKIVRNSGKIEFILKSDWGADKDFDVAITVLRMPFSVTG